jgi:hypothetical protein
MVCFHLRRIPVRPAAYAKLFVDRYAADYIRMNNVLPGWIDSLPGAEERRQQVPMQRYGRSQEIAATIAFLTSEGGLHHSPEHPRRWRPDPFGLMRGNSIRRTP